MAASMVQAVCKSGLLDHKFISIVISELFNVNRTIHDSRLILNAI